MKLIAIALFVIAFLLSPVVGWKCPKCWIPSAALVGIGIWTWRES